MKKTVILAVTLLLAALPMFGASGLYITEINHATGRFKLSDYTSWGALNKRDIKDWKAGDGITGGRSASCGNDPNVYLLTDTDESESACALRIGR
jgi:hypothetical protein